MNGQPESRNSNTNQDIYTINMRQRDRIMAAAYLARSEYLAELLLNASRSLSKLATSLMQSITHRKPSHNSWFAP